MFTRICAAMAAALMLAVLPAAGASPSAAAPAPAAGPVSVVEGSRSEVVGRVPKAYGNSLVVLEIVSGKKRQELGFGVSEANGRVSVPIVVGGEGAYQARWRVVRDGRTRWTSDPFTLAVVRKGKPSFSSRAESVFQHAVPSGTGARQARGGPVTQSATAVAAEAASKTSGQMMNDLGKSMLEGAGSSAVGDGVTALYDVIFPGAAPATAGEIQQLSSQVTAGFSAVEAQLQQVQASLSQVQQQVTLVQNEVVQANASAAAATCATLLGQANTYVNDIQTIYGNYETTLDPQWIQANLVGQGSQTGLRILGTTIFGTGAGQPPFGDGVSQLQTSVSALGRLLTADGPSSSVSLLGACASAIAANVDVQYSQAQTAQGLQQSQAIIAAGAVDEAYFSAMQSLTAYYSSWLALGQTLAARGGQMGLALLDGSSITSASQVNTICKGQVPQQGSVLTCGGILANIQQSGAYIDSAWAETGASWFDVTNEFLVADTKAGNASGFFTAPRNLWVQDIARYGENLPLVGATSSTTTLAGATFSTGTSTPFLTIDTDYTTSGLGTPGPTVTLTGTINAGQVSSPLSPLTFTSTTGQAYPAGGPQYLAVVGLPDSYQANNTYVPWTVTLPLGAPGTPQVYTATYGAATNVNGYSQTITWSYTGLSQQLTSDGTSSYTPSGPLTSTAAGQSVPASMMPFSQLAASSWLGFSFQPATTATWQWLIATGSRPLSSAATGDTPPAAGMPGYLGTVGSLMSQAGLMNYGSPPSNLILWTGETGTFDPSTATDWFQLEPSASTFENSNMSGYGVATLTPTPSVSAYSFLDANAGLLAGMNPVVSPPSTGIGFATTLGNVMNGGSGTLAQAFCSPPTEQQESCTTSVDASFSLSGGPTGNSTFYSPYTVNYSYDAKAAYGQTSGSVTYSNYADSVGALNSTFMGQQPQVQYGWPVSPLSGGVPAGRSCTLTSFTQGVDGNAGITNVCADLYSDWMAGAVGVSTGPVTVSGGGYQGTVTTAGNNVMQAVIQNTGSSAQTVTLYARGSNGAQVGTTAVAASGGSAMISNLACGSPVTGTLECSLSAPPGVSLISIPLVSSNGAVNIALGSRTSASSSITQVTATAASLTELPGAVTDLTAVAANSAGTAVALQWDVPSATPPVSGYAFVLTSPTGTSTTLTTGGSSPVSVSASGGTASATITLPATQAGVWTIGVSAQNAAGAGPVTTITAALGNSVPASPTGFQAESRDDGLIRLTWNPVTASPALTNYTILITTPGTATQPPQTITEVSNVPTFTLYDVPQLGRYTFSLTANNSLGASQPVVTTLNVTGTVPTPPLAVDVTVDAEGWISASWLSALSTPPADSYQVALYGPGATATSVPMASVQVPAPMKASTIRVPDIYQLAKNSQPGAWLVVVTPTNVVGTGQFGTAQLVVTSGLLSRITKLQADAGSIAAAPAVALDRARAACTAGTWTIGYAAFGRCANGVFTPHTLR